MTDVKKSFNVPSNVLTLLHVKGHQIEVLANRNRVLFYAGKFKAH